MAKKSWIKKAAKGFTLAEFMIAIAIMSILAGVGTVSVIHYQRRLKLMEADATAKELFLAAQNHMTGSWASGEWETLLKTKPDSYFGDSDADIAGSLTDEEKADHSYFYISNASSTESNALNDVLLPYGAMDESIRMSGTFILEYDKTTATVYDVYYVDAIYSDEVISVIKNDAASVKSFYESGDKSARITLGQNHKELANNTAFNTGFYIGYYGKGISPIGPVNDYEDPIIRVKNENNLWIEIDDKNALKSKYDDTVLTVVYTGRMSHKSVAFRIPLTANDGNQYKEVAKGDRYLDLRDSTTNAEIEMYYESSHLAKYIDNGGVRTYYLLLDSLTFDQAVTNSASTNNVYGQFGRHFSKYGFLLGEDIGITAYLSSKKAGEQSSAYDMTNPLFKAIIPEAPNSSYYFAAVQYPRHLQNLSKDASGLTYIASSTYNNFNFIGANLDNDVYWETFNGNEGYYDQLQRCPEGDLFSEWKKEYINKYNPYSDKNLVAKESTGMYFRPINNSYNKNGDLWPKFDASFIFNGNNYTIHRLTIYRYDADLGLFAQITHNGSLTIEDLDIEDPKVATDTENNLGVFCGKINNNAKLVLKNCHSYMSSADEYKAGTYNPLTYDATKIGITKVPGRGVNSPSICAGGLVGNLMSGTAIIENCSASVPVILNAVIKGTGAGGVVGYIAGANLTMTNSYCGGFTEPVADGSSYSDYSIEHINVASFGAKIDGNCGSAGLVGLITSGTATIDNCYSTASSYSTKYASGLVNKQGGKVVITNSYTVGRTFYQRTKVDDNSTKLRFGAAFAGNKPDTVNNVSFLNFVNDAYEFPEGCELFDTCYSDNYAKSTDESTLNRTGIATTKTYNSILGTYPYITVNQDTSFNNYDHIGDWAKPAPKARTFEGNWGVIYYEIVQNGNNKLDKAAYYNGYIIRAFDENPQFVSINTRNTLRPEGNVGDNGLLNEQSGKYVVEAGYLVLVDHTENENDLLRYGFDNNSYKLDKNPAFVKYNDVLNDLRITGYDAYYVDSLNNEFSRFYSYNDEFVCYVKEQDYYVAKNRLYFNPFFANEIGTSSQLENKTHEVRSAHGLKALFEITGGSYISNAYGRADTANQTMDIIFDSDIVTLTIPEKEGDNEGKRVEFDSETNKSIVWSYNSPTLWNGNDGGRSLVGTYDGRNHIIQHLLNPFMGENAGTLKNAKFRDVQAPYLILNNVGTLQNVTVENASFQGNNSKYSGNTNNGFLGKDNFYGSNADTITLRNIVAGGNGFANANYSTAKKINIVNAQIGKNGFVQTTNGGSFEDCHIYGDASIYGYQNSYASNRRRYAPNTKTKEDFNPKFGDSTYGYNYVTIGLSKDKDKESVNGNYYGFAAEINNSTAINNCSITGKVYGKNNSAGFIGTNTGSTITNSYANTLVFAKDGTASGFADKNAGGTISNCHSVGIINADTGVGFLATADQWNGSNNNNYTAVWSTSSTTYYPFTKKIEENTFYNCYYLDAIEGVEPQNTEGKVQPASSKELQDNTSLGKKLSNDTSTRAYNQYIVYGNTSTSGKPNGRGYTYPMATSSTIQYGDWKDNIETIRFDSNGKGAYIESFLGVSYNSEIIHVSREKGEKITELPVPTWPHTNGLNYVFLGWYTERDATSGEKVTIPEGGLPVTETIYYAHWAVVWEFDPTEAAVRYKNDRTGIYQFEAWGSGTDKPVQGSMYIDGSNYEFNILAGTNGAGSYVERNKNEGGIDNKIMVSAGTNAKNSGYYSPDGKNNVSFVSGQEGYNATSWFSNSENILFTEQSVSYTGWVFGDYKFYEAPKPEGKDGFVRVSRLVVSREDGTNESSALSNFSKGQKGGLNYKVIKKDNGSTIINDSDSLNVLINDVISKEDILNLNVFKVRVSSKVDYVNNNKEFPLGTYTKETENSFSVKPSTAGLSGTAKNKGYYSENNGTYTFIKAGKFGDNTESLGYNEWKFKTNNNTEINWSNSKLCYVVDIDGDPFVELLCDDVTAYVTDDPYILQVKGKRQSEITPENSDETTPGESTDSSDETEGTTQQNGSDDNSTNEDDGLTFGELIDNKYLSYSSSNETVVTVTDQGVLEYKGAGSAKITITCNIYALHVPLVKEITVTVNSSSINVKRTKTENPVEGTNDQLKVVLTTSDPENPVELTGDQMKEVVWSVVDSAGKPSDVAEIDETGVITYLKAGEATVRASYRGVSAKLNIVVSEAAVSSITLSRTDLVEEGEHVDYEGQTANLSAVVKYENNKEVTLAGEQLNSLGFMVTDEQGVTKNIATVSNGVVSFVHAGTCKVKASSGTVQSNELTFTIVANVPSNVTIKVTGINETTEITTETSDASLSLDVDWTDGSKTEVSGDSNDIIWTMKPSGCISINEGGNITFNQAGACSVSATYSNVVSESKTFTVTDPTPIIYKQVKFERCLPANEVGIGGKIYPIVIGRLEDDSWVTVPSSKLEITTDSTNYSVSNGVIICNNAADWANVTIKYQEQVINTFGVHCIDNTSGSVTGISVDPQNISVIVDSSQQVTVNLIYSDGSTKKLEGYEWQYLVSFTNPNIAKYDNGGFKGLSVGSSVTTIKLGDFSKTINITVTDGSEYFGNPAADFKFTDKNGITHSVSSFEWPSSGYPTNVNIRVPGNKLYHYNNDYYYVQNDSTVYGGNINSGPNSTSNSILIKNTVFDASDFNLYNNTQTDRAFQGLIFNDSDSKFYVFKNPSSWASLPSLDPSNWVDLTHLLGGTNGSSSVQSTKPNLFMTFGPQASVPFASEEVTFASLPVSSPTMASLIPQVTMNDGSNDESKDDSESDVNMIVGATETAKVTEDEKKKEEGITDGTSELELSFLTVTDKEDTFDAVDAEEIHDAKDDLTEAKHNTIPAFVTHNSFTAEEQTGTKKETVLLPTSSPTIAQLMEEVTTFNPNELEAADVFTTADTYSVSYYMDQQDAVLPVLWQRVGEDKFRINPYEYEWRSDDEDIVVCDWGAININNVGETNIHTTIMDEEITIHVTVNENPDITGFKEKGSDYSVALTNGATFSAETKKWPTIEPKDNTAESVKVYGTRIVEESGAYYLIADDFEADWDELAGNIGSYLSDADEDGNHYVVKLPVGELLDEDDFFEDGEPKVELLPGDAYRNDDTVYVMINSDKEIRKPEVNADGWFNLKDMKEYIPGADTGPETDLLSYPGSEFNPYPGTIKSNCTYAVWALVNQTLGLKLPGWGNAGSWLRRAQISGYPTGNKPAKYSIIVFDTHVGFVTDVSEDGTMMFIKEGNYAGKYHEQWWSVGSTRGSLKVQGYIYLTNDKGENIEAETIVLDADFHDSEEAFLLLLKDFGLEPGEWTEEYSDDVEKGHIVSYRKGEYLKGSVVDYVVSLGPEPAKTITVNEEFVQKPEAELLDWFDKNGKLKGSRIVVDADGNSIEDEDDHNPSNYVVVSIKTGEYEEGAAVSYTVTKKVQETEPSVPTEDPVITDPETTDSETTNPETVDPATSETVTPVSGTDPQQEATAEQVIIEGTGEETKSTTPESTIVTGNDTEITGNLITEGSEAVGEEVIETPAPTLETTSEPAAESTPDTTITE